MTASPRPFHDSDGNANRAKTNELIHAFKGFPHKNLRSGNGTPVAALMAAKCGNQTGTARQRRAFPAPDNGPGFQVGSFLPAAAQSGRFDL
jgi:hypothetical protein